MKKQSGGIITCIIAVIVCIIAFVSSKGIVSSALKLIVNIAAVVIVVAIILFAIILFAARKSTKKDEEGKKKAKNKEGLTKEQLDSLNTARSQLVDVRMTISRLKDSEIRTVGNEACASIEKVLMTLRDKPEKIQTTRQLFNYYLPTLQKVINKFQRVEQSGVMDPEMPGKLKKYLQDIKEAMSKLYEGLFENDKLNIEVNMEAMTIAIKRDGLLDDEDFK